MDASRMAQHLVVRTLPGNWLWIGLIHHSERSNYTGPCLGLHMNYYEMADPVLARYPIRQTEIKCYQLYYSFGVSVTNGYL